jgi:peroxiredoxin
MSWRKKLARMVGLEAPLTRVDVGIVAPKFSLKATDGKEYSLAALLERGPVVIGFFKISCPVCQFTFPFLQRIADRFAGKNATVIGVSQDDARSTKEFNQEYGVKFPTLLDDEDGYPVSNEYGITNVPTVLLVGTNGKAEVSLVGFDKAGLEKIAAVLAQRDKAASAPLFKPSEVIPDFKPG